MLDDANSTPAQKADEQLALDRVNGTQERTDWFDKVDLSDQKDATSYTGLKNSLSYYDTANGIRKVCLIETPVAAAIGAGLDISRPHGSMVVKLGEGVSDIGVLSMNRLSVSGSIAVGGAVFNEDIIKYARRKFDLIIGEQTAEAAKCAVGCAFPLKDIEKYELRGRDERNGLPAKVEVTSDEIGEAMLESVVKVVHKIQSVLEETPPELTADIGNAGIVLTGGGAKLRGLDTLISKQTKMRVRIAEEPEDCVILGAGRAVQWIDSVKMDAGKENGNVPLTAYY